ncbi:hypothetical protein ACXD50_004788 [Escherichia coli]|nr:hypothetical protein [Escherichia coli]
MNERLKTHSKTQKKSADLVSNKLRIGVFQRYQMKCKSVSKKSPRYTIHTFIFTSAVVRLADIQRGEGKAEWQKRSLRGRFLRIVFIAVNHRQMRKQLRKTQQLCAKSVSKGYVTWPRRV